MKKYTTQTIVTNMVIVAVLAVLAATTLLATHQTTQAFAPIRQGKTAKTVAITVNVYLGTEYVEQIADYLTQNNIPATFFVGGCWLVKHAETGQKLVQNGFCIGSHGYSHLDHSTLSYGQNVEELSKAKKAIDALLGTDIHLFAPPSGAYNDATLAACQDLGYTVVMWSKDAIDWRDQEVDIIVQRTTKDKGDSEILLLHPTAATVSALPQIVDSYLSSGYRFVSIDEMCG